MSPFLCTHVYLLCDEWENFLLSISIWCIDMRLRPKKKKKKWHLMVIFHKQTPHVALYAIVFALQVIYYIVTLYSYKFKSWWWHTHTHTNTIFFLSLHFWNVPLNVMKLTHTIKTFTWYCEKKLSKRSCDVSAVWR